MQDHQSTQDIKNCPICGSALEIDGDEYVCKNSGCHYTASAAADSRGKWLLTIAANKTYWQERYFNELPTFIAHEYYRLRLMALYPNVFCMVYQIKDVCEVLLKLPVLCAAAYLKEVKGDDSVGAKLIRKKMSLGDWVEICSELTGVYDGNPNYELPDFLSRILSRAMPLCGSNLLQQGRNDYIGHGALGFDDNKQYRDFSRELMKSVSGYLKDTFDDYGKMIIKVGDRTLRGRDYPTYLDPDAQPVLVMEDREIPLDPFIVNKPGEGLLFFDHYIPDNSARTAFGLDYMIGGGRKRFLAPYYLEIYNRYYKNTVNSQPDDAKASVDESTMDQQVEELLHSLNTAENFVRPDYIIQWINGWHRDAKGSIHLLTMDRGMGKTSLSYALASKKVKELSDTMVVAYYCGSSQIQRDYISGINRALATGIVEMQAGTFKNLKPDAEDKPGNMLESLTYFRDRHIHHQHGSKLMLIIDGLDELPVECAGLFDYIPDSHDIPDNVYLLLTSRNAENESLPAHVVSGLAKLAPADSMTVRANAKDDDDEASKANRELLRKYVRNNIRLPAKNEKGYRKPKPEESETFLKRSGNTFLNLKLYEKLAESGILVSELPELDDRALFERYLREIRKYYGNKLFDEAMTMLYAIVTAEEPLTAQEVAWLSGEEHVTLKQMTFMKDFGALLKTVRAREDNNVHGQTGHITNTRGPLISASSQRYRDFIKEMFPEKRQQQAALFTDRILHTGVEQYKDVQGNYILPDGLIYIAAYLPAVTEDISEMVMERVCDDIDRCILNSIEPHVLMRRAVMGEKWSFLCGKKKWYKQQINFINNAGNSYSTMCEYSKSLEWKEQCVNLCKQYISSEFISDLNLLARAYINRGVSFRIIGEYDRALYDYCYGISIRETLYTNDRLQNINDLASAYMNRGIIYRYKEQYQNALDDYDKCLEIRMNLHKQGQLKHVNDIAKVYLNRGMTYRVTGQYTNAIKDYDDCIEIREKLVKNGKMFIIKSLAKTYRNRGVVFDDMSEFSKALNDFNSCIHIMEKLVREDKLFDYNDLAKSYMNRGITYRVTGNYTEALNDYNTSINIMEDLKKQGRLFEPDFLARTYMYRGLIYDDYGEYNQALKNYDASISIWERLKNKKKIQYQLSLSTVYLNRGVTYQETNDYSNALLDYDKCLHIRNKLYQEGHIYDIGFFLGAVINNKSILIETGLKDPNGALAFLESFIPFFQSDKNPSYSTNQVLKMLLFQFNHLIENKDAFMAKKHSKAYLPMDIECINGGCLIKEEKYRLKI